MLDDISSTGTLCVLSPTGTNTRSCAEADVSAKPRCRLRLAEESLTTSARTDIGA
jgi:hypothetical protein